MSEDTIRRDILSKCAQADKMEAMANDPNHIFSSESRRDTLRAEARRLREEARCEDQYLTRRHEATDTAPRAT